MVQKYQNEISPIFYYGKSPKTNEKDLKIPILQPPDWKHPYWMFLYILYTVCLNIHISLQNIMNVLDPIKSVQLKLRIYKQFCNKPLYLKTLCNSAKINLNIHYIEWKNFWSSRSCTQHYR